MQLLYLQQVLVTNKDNKNQTVLVLLTCLITERLYVETDNSNVTEVTVRVEGLPHPQI